MMFFFSLLVSIKIPPLYKSEEMPDAGTGYPDITVFEINLTTFD